MQGDCVAWLLRDEKDRVSGEGTIFTQHLTGALLEGRISTHMADQGLVALVWPIE